MSRESSIHTAESQPPLAAQLAQVKAAAALALWPAAWRAIQDAGTARPKAWSCAVSAADLVHGRLLAAERQRGASK